MKKLRIAIFHNLKTGGALKYISCLTRELAKKNDLYLYSFQKDSKCILNKKYVYVEIKHTNNILDHLFQIIYELKQKSKIIAGHINENNYDIVIVCNDYLIQSPYLLKYIDTKKCVLFYLSNEQKREFYEKTSYDHYSFRRTLSRIFRYVIKFIDYDNCKKASNIITNSYYSQLVFKKIYKKDSYVIHPGMVRHRLIKHQLKNSDKYISYGPLTYLKNHDALINFINQKTKLLIVGSTQGDSDILIKKCANRNNVRIIKDVSLRELNRISKYNFLFLATQTNEPFGLSTLEIACSHKYIVGKNLGGTSEIIDHGVSGFLVPINKMFSMYKYISIKKDIIYYSNRKISWAKTTQSFLNLYHFLKNESAY